MSVVTNGVFSQIPGSAGGPSVAIVVPSSLLGATGSTASASARSSADVVSNSSTVRAAGGGGGGGVGSNVSGGVTGATGSTTPGAAVGVKSPSKEGDSQAASAKTGISAKYLMNVTVCRRFPADKGRVKPCAIPCPTVAFAP